MAAAKWSSDPALAKIVERQIRNWELARQQRLSVPAPERKEVEDFITISRNVGAGGREVARLLGERLKWPLFDNEILTAMAGSDDLRRQVYASMDERDISWFEETLRSLMDSGFIKNDYFRRLSEAVLSIARQGRAVFLGRGTDQILPRTVGFRARLVAPIAMCVERYAQQRKLPMDKARAEVSRLEQERAHFIRHHFRVDADGPARHDLVINMERFTQQQAVELILSARQFPGRES